MEFSDAYLKFWKSCMLSFVYGILSRYWQTGSVHTLNQGSATCGSRATCGSLNVKLWLFSSILKYYLFYQKEKKHLKILNRLTRIRHLFYLCHLHSLFTSSLLRDTLRLWRQYESMENSIRIDRSCLLSYVTQITFRLVSFATKNLHTLRNQI